MVLDWVIGYETCEDVATNKSAYTYVEGLAHVKIPSTGLGIPLQVQGRLQWKAIPQRWFIFLF